MKILIALTYYRPHYSGLTIYAEREARALVQRGHQVTILTSQFNPSLPTREIQHGVEIIRLPVLFRISKGVIMPGMLPTAWKQVRQADIVHLHVPQLDAAPIALIARLLDKPLVLTYHCDLHLPPGLVNSVANWASNLANQFTANAANLIVHNTQDYAENSSFMKPFLAKSRAVFPPVVLCEITEQHRQAFRQKFGILPGQRLIGMAARLATEKGVEYLAQALPIVIQKFPTARVLFVGPYQDILGEEQYAQKLLPQLESLSEHWSFLGVVTDEEMAAFFQECEVTVLPSINRTESYGIVQIESMLSGTPVIASDLPGIRVPVQITGSGLIVPPANPQALAEALIALLENPSAYRGHPEEIIQMSRPQAVAQIYEAIFQELLANRGK